VIAAAAARGHTSTLAACRWFDISRQAYYQARRRQLQREAEEALLVSLVQGVRQRHPRMGGRKLYHELAYSMKALGITRGRDAFFDLLRRHHLLVPAKRSRRRTTRSGWWRCPNLLAEMELHGPYQAWVGDITYILTEERFVYLAVLMDAFSRFIVGYDLSSSLAVEGSLRTLEQAVEQAPNGQLLGLVHHSDHGVQYTAGPYRERLESLGMRPSMGQVGNCYDNALAERVIGILKCEYSLDDLYVNLEHAQTAVREAIWLYNHERPHLSLNYRKPVDVHFSI
jgi:putative transposase